MKRFLAISLMVAGFTIKASACADFGTHNYYMMSLYPKWQWEQNNDDRYHKFWSAYTDGEVWSFFPWAKDQIVEITRKKNDMEMAEYVELLSAYLDNCGEISNGWDYPTAEQLNKQDATMEEILDAARKYHGTRLRPQYALMEMRANMQLERHQDNIKFWNETGAKLPESVYRDVMKNIYAGALLRTGQRKAAWNIYAEQGDWVSLRWSVFKYRNLAGIKSIYESEPNAEVLGCLVQDFVNSAQETYDNLHSMAGLEDFTEAEKVEWVNDNVNMVGCNPVYEAEIINFINFAYQVVSEKKNSDPALWMSAAALLRYYMGDYAAAMNDADKAQKLDGSDRVKDNARAIRLLVATSGMKIDKKFSAYVVKELDWLDQKIKGEGAYDDYFTHAKDRIVNIGLAPRYKKEGYDNIASALWGLEVVGYKLSENSEVDDDDSWNQGYCKEFYYTTLGKMKAEEVKAYYDFLTGPHKDELEKMVVGKILETHNADYFNDLIGTKYLAAGQFADAVPYLEKVSLKFMEGQNISWYLANRDYSKARWFGKQSPSDSDEYVDGPHKGVITANKKLLFCKEMQQLMARHLLAPAGEQRRQMAYDMAVRYYQASPWGDCWFLSDYGWTSYRDIEEPIPAFVQSAITYLNEAKASTDTKLRQESLFALAYIPVDEWQVYRWEDDGWQLNPGSQQYQALGELSEFIRQNPSAAKVSYILHCDVLKQFQIKTR